MSKPQGMGCFFWFVAFPIVILHGVFHFLWTWLKGGNEMDKKRRITNIIGIVVLGTIILGVTTERGIQYFRERQRIKNAEAITLQKANDLAEAFANDSSGDLVMKWARNDGEYLDVWDRPFMLVQSSLDGGVQVRSAGADGQFHTDDDILSRIYDYEKNKLKIETRPAEGKMGEIKERLEGASRKAKEVLEDVEVETEKEERGWKFRFSWGKDKD